MRVISITASTSMTNTMAALTCVPIAAPEATMIASTNTVASGAGAFKTPVMNATHQDPFVSHASWARPSIRETVDQPGIYAAFSGSRRIAPGRRLTFRHLPEPTHCREARLRIFFTPPGDSAD